MGMAKRKRDKSITIRMDTAEYEDLRNKVKESGLTQQAYVIGAIRGAMITTSEEIEVLKEISSTFSDLDRQIRGIATNVNQMARVANGQGIDLAEDQLKEVYCFLQKYRKESADLWQSIRSLISHH